MRDGFAGAFQSAIRRWPTLPWCFIPALATSLCAVIGQPRCVTFCYYDSSGASTYVVLLRHPYLSPAVGRTMVQEQDVVLSVPENGECSLWALQQLQRFDALIQKVKRVSAKEFVLSKVKQVIFPMLGQCGASSLVAHSPSIVTFFFKHLICSIAYFELCRAIHTVAG